MLLVIYPTLSVSKYFAIFIRMPFALISTLQVWSCYHIISNVTIYDLVDRDNKVMTTLFLLSYLVKSNKKHIPAYEKYQ